MEDPGESSLFKVPCQGTRRAIVSTCPSGATGFFFPHIRNIDSQRCGKYSTVCYFTAGQARRTLARGTRFFRRRRRYLACDYVRVRRFSSLGLGRGGEDGPRIVCTTFYSRLVVYSTHHSARDVREPYGMRDRWLDGMINPVFAAERLLWRVFSARG